MTNSINNAIPFVPENTIDPAAGLNESINVIDALLQVRVLTMGANTPPASPASGDRHIVGTAPTGAWASQANKLARWYNGGWSFSDAAVVVNLADNKLYIRGTAGWRMYVDQGVAADDPRLSDAREWSAETVAQAEAEAGTANTRSAWTAQRVRQAIVAWWNSVSSAWGRGFVSSADAAAGRTALSVREQLTADRTYYVRTDGSDSNNGLANTAGGAFLTIQKAVDAAASLDLGIFNCTIQVADGTYNGAVVLKHFVGAGQIRIIGNEATPANVIITGGGSLIYGTDFGRYLLAGVTLASSGLRNVQILGTCILEYRNIVFQGSASLNTHLHADRGALAMQVGPVTFNGATQLGVQATGFGYAYIRSNTITFAAGTTMAAGGFSAVDQGRVDMIAMTFSGTFTGPRYRAIGLGAVFTNGAGESYIPGSAAGSTATGGLYY